MRKFWTIVLNAGYDVGVKNSRINEPLLPTAVGHRAYTMPGDIRVAETGHNHLVMGSVLLPSSEDLTDPTHWHWIIPNDGGGINQIYVGGGVEHSHTGALQGYPDGEDYVQPKYYILLITCDDAEYTNLADNGVDVYAERAATETTDENGNPSHSFAPLSTDEWGAGKRTAIKNRLKSALGLDLPEIITNDRRFISWILDFGGWRPEQESKHN